MQKSEMEGTSFSCGNQMIWTELRSNSSLRNLHSEIQHRHQERPYQISLLLKSGTFVTCRWLNDRLMTIWSCLSIHQMVYQLTFAKVKSRVKGGTIVIRSPPAHSVSGSQSRSQLIQSLSSLQIRWANRQRSSLLVTLRWITNFVEETPIGTSQLSTRLRRQWI